MNRLTVSILVLLFISAIFIVTKHTYFFNDDGSVKNLGIGVNETLVPFYFISLLGGIITYLGLSFQYNI